MKKFLNFEAFKMFLKNIDTFVAGSDIFLFFYKK